MFSRRALIPYIVISTIPIAVLVMSAKNMYATSLLVEPKKIMEKWACNGGIDNMEEWEVSKHKLEKANSLHKNNADIVSDLGRVHEFKALTLPVWKPEAKENRSKAIAYYRQATLNRPTWALAWLNLAQAKIINQEADEQTFTAIRNGFRFGKWQEIVQQRLLWLSVGIWPVLPDDIKESVRDVVSKALAQDYNLHMLMLVAIRFGWQNELKPLMLKAEHFALLEMYQNNPALRNQMEKQQSNKLVC